MKFATCLKVAAVVGLLFTAAGALNAATVYNVNFSSGPTVPTGFTNYAPATFFAFEAETYNLGGGVTLHFDGVNNYTQPDTTNPLIAGGHFLGQGLSSAFQISGLTPGMGVTLYAIDAWDGAGRAGYVTFGGNTIDTALAPNDGFTGSTPGLSPTTADMVLVNSNVIVGGTGILTGSFFADAIRPEGQLGAFVISVAAVPEPSTWAMLAGGVTLLLVSVHRRRRVVNQ